MPHGSAWPLIQALASGSASIHAVSDLVRSARSESSCSAPAELRSVSDLSPGLSATNSGSTDMLSGLSARSARFWRSQVVTGYDCEISLATSRALRLSVSFRCFVASSTAKAIANPPTAIGAGTTGLLNAVSFGSLANAAGRVPRSTCSRAKKSACCTWLKLNSASFVQNDGRQDAVSSFRTTDPPISTTSPPPVAEQASPVGANVSGTVTRLRQFDADHQNDPRTAWSELFVESRVSPASYAPVRRHVVSALACWVLVRGLPFDCTCGAPILWPQASQLIPTLGTT